MKIKKYEKGITLIALIITIIVLLILAVVAISAVQDSDIIKYAKKAVSSTDMAEIREQAELVKSEMFLEEKINNIMSASKQMYINKLLEKFPGSERKGDKVVVDGTYDIVIKNSNLDIEVKEHSDIVKLNELMEFSYEIKPLIQVGDKIYSVEIDFNAEPIMTSSEYQTLMESQEVKEDVPYEQKEAKVLEVLSEESGQTITELDQFTLYMLNDFGNRKLDGINRDSIPEWLAEPKLLEYFKVTSITKEQANGYFYAENGSKPLTNEQAIEYLYDEFTYTDYTSEYYANTQDVTVSNDKGEIISLYTNYSITKNGTYEFELKNKNGEVIGFEKITINYLQPENKQVLVSEEEISKWETDGKGTITGYSGNEKEVTIPMYIGTEYITKVVSININNNTNVEKVIVSDSIIEIGVYVFRENSSIKEIVLSQNLKKIDSTSFIECTSLKEITIPNSVTKMGYGAFDSCSSLEKVTLSNSMNFIPSLAFWNCKSLKEVVIPESITSISNSFADCTSLEKITIPNSVTSIDSQAFQNCTNLKNIYFAPGDNDIPTEGRERRWGAPINVNIEKLPKPAGEE